MAIVALHSAATGLSALSTELDVIANNLANVNTTGFKRARANFENLLYQEKAQPGVENVAGDLRPAGLYVGLGTRLSNTQFNFEQGSPIDTSGDFDMMIHGDGFFRVTVPEEGNGVAFTRAGNFFRNQDGNLVLGNSEGPLLDPPINVPAEARNISISSNGVITGQLAGQTVRTEFGQVELATFVNPNGLRALGGNLYGESDASGPPIEGEPGQGSFGKILHKFLESSNVDPVRELTDLIQTQRAFEMNSQSIQAADNALQVISNLRRF